MVLRRQDPLASDPHVLVPLHNLEYSPLCTALAPGSYSGVLTSRCRYTWWALLWQRLPSLDVGRLCYPVQLNGSFKQVSTGLSTWNHRNEWPRSSGSSFVDRGSTTPARGPPVSALRRLIPYPSPYQAGNPLFIWPYLRSEPRCLFQNFQDGHAFPHIRVNKVLYCLT